MLGGIFNEFPQLSAVEYDCKLGEIVAHYLIHTDAGTSFEQRFGGVPHKCGVFPLY